MWDPILHTERIPSRKPASPFNVASWLPKFKRTKLFPAAINHLRRNWGHYPIRSHGIWSGGVGVRADYANRRRQPVWTVSELDVVDDGRRDAIGTHGVSLRCWSNQRAPGPDGCPWRGASKWPRVRRPTRRTPRRAAGGAMPLCCGFCGTWWSLDGGFFFFPLFPKGSRTAYMATNRANSCKPALISSSWVQVRLMLNDGEEAETRPLYTATSNWMQHIGEFPLTGGMQELWPS